jgi:hypothetical protein
MARQMYSERTTSRPVAVPFFELDESVQREENSTKQLGGRTRGGPAIADPVFIWFCSRVPMAHTLR